MTNIEKKRAELQRRINRDRMEGRTGNIQRMQFELQRLTVQALRSA